MDKLNKTFEKFFNSIYLLLVISIFSILSWSYSNPSIILITNSILVFGIIKYKVNPMIIIMLGFSILASMNKFEAQEVFTLSNIVGLILIVIAIIALIYDFIKNREKVKPKNIVIYSFAAFLLTAVIAMIKAPDVIYSLSYFAQYTGVFLIMCYVFCTTKYTKENINYLVQILIFVSFIIMAEMTICYFRLYDPTDPFAIIERKGLQLGWAIGNTYSAILAMSLLATGYYYINNSSFKIKLFSVGIIFAQFLAIAICLSRGAILGLALAAPVMVILIFYFSNNKKKELLYLISLLSLVLILFGLLYNIEVFKNLIDNVLLDDYTNDNGRWPIYDLAIIKFKDSWFIGNGMHSSHYYLLEDINKLNYHYHNYILQAMADQGILGLITFLSFVATTIYCCFKKDSFKLIGIAMTFYMLGHGFVDATFNAPRIMLIYMTCIGFIIKEVEVKNNEENIASSSLLQ